MVLYAGGYKGNLWWNPDSAEVISSTHAAEFSIARRGPQNFSFAFVYGLRNAKFRVAMVGVRAAFCLGTAKIPCLFTRHSLHACRVWGLGFRV